MKIIIFYLLVSISISSQSNESNTLIDLLVNAKATGMCGAIVQLTSFQESTKMPGGDEFLIRFIQTEAARLGKTLPQFLEQCKTSAAIYSSTMKSLGFDQ